MTDTEFEKRFTAARKAVIESEFSRLNDMQRSAVCATEGPLLLLAGAGSGKTTVLINRIANLIKYGRGSDTDEIPDGLTEEDLEIVERAAADPSCPEMEEARRLAAVEPVEPWRIIAITFTNKAADELKARLENMLGECAQDIWAMTFHSACVRILRRNADRLGYANSFTIYDTSDSQSVMKRILKDFDLDEKTFPYRSVLNAISKAKDAMVTPEEYCTEADKSGDIRRKTIGRAYMEYARRLREADAMDFDDLIYNAVILLKDNEDVRDYYQRKFRYVLIDEYQDTNTLQYMLASSLAGGYENICVVGDDDQSIYRFRGATIENILSFEKQYKGSRVIKLEQNYRSTGHILEAANGVIKNNQGRKGKNLWTQSDMGDKITLYSAYNENDEAQYVASRILAQYSAGGKWSDNAILYRMNAQSNQMEYAFKRNGIPYRIVGGTRFFDRAEVKDMLAYLCVIFSPNDDLRLSRIINTPARGIGTKTVDIARGIAQEEEKSLFEIISDAGSYPALQRSQVKLREFANMISELRETAQSQSADVLYDEIIERTGYIRALDAKKSDENTARIENVKELKTNIITYMKESGDESLAGFLDEVALYTDLDSLDAGSDSVVMMTMHSAKGLEFPNVFIVGAEEGMFPSTRCIGEPEEMEEERRLCYVAITRARERLWITCARQRMIFGRTSSNKLSRFVEEIPEEHIEKPAPKRPEDTSAGRYQSGGGASGYGGRTRQRTAPVPPAPSVRAPSAAEKPERSFKVGDTVRHKAFGSGRITKMTPMGSDSLVEIEFENIGAKRLMLKVASQSMEKQP